MGATGVRVIEQGSVAESKMSLAHLVVPGAGLAAIALAVASDNAIAYVIVVMLVPVITLIAARGVSVGRAGSADESVDRRGYLAASLFVLVASVLGLASQRLPGPALLITMAFVYLGWLRRDALTAAVSFAALLAVAPVDIKGPLSRTFIEPDVPQRVASLLLVAAVMISIGLVQYSRQRHTRHTT